MPETLMNYVTTHESFSVSGKKKGEKVLILCMRTLKQLLPPGDVNSWNVEASLSERYRNKVKKIC